MSCSGLLYAAGEPLSWSVLGDEYSQSLSAEATTSLLYDAGVLSYL